MYHDLLNQFVEDIGCQLCDAGIFPDEGQEPLDILVDLIALGDLRRQLLPLSLKLRLFSFVLGSHGLIPFLTDLLQRSILIKLIQYLRQLLDALVHPFQFPLTSVDFCLLFFRME